VNDSLQPCGASPCFNKTNCVVAFHWQPMITHDPERVGYTRMDEKREQKDTEQKKRKCFKSCYFFLKINTTLNIVLDTI